MEFSVEKFITPFIESQFPQFYQEEGPNFVLFAKAYYEWMEEQGNPIGEARNLFDYRDIDNTLESFLEYFQKKYLYGIPFSIIVNKRYLLKHILDVYRSKSSIECYKLLFRLIYNEDVDVYLPSRDMLRVSDGVWKEPKYVEVNDTGFLDNYVGKEIFGLTSNTSAVVESFIKQPINQNIISTLYISNIEPKGGSFIQGEKLIIDGYRTAEDIEMAPTVLGSLDSVDIINGGQGFNVGDIIKIVHRDLSNNSVISYGVDGELRVTEVSRGLGALNFSIYDGGFGFTSNAMMLLYNSPTDTTGNGASFSIGTLSFTQEVQYNTDLIADYANLSLNSTSFGFPANSSANISSNVGITLSFQNNIFGTIFSLSNIKTGNDYTQAANVFVRSTLLSNALVGSVTYNTTSNTVTGTSTLFTSYFSNNDVIALRANSADPSTEEYVIVKNVNSNTSITLYGPPKNNSTASAVYKIAPVILPANFALSDPIMYRPDSTINGQNEIIAALPSSGNNIVSKAVAINSGKGYVDGEVVKLYLYSGLNTPTVITGGVNYSNGESLIFSGGGTTSAAEGFITTNTSGGIVSASITYQGSGYSSIPVINVKTKNGSGAYLTTTLSEFNTFSEITGRVKKTGIGKQKGSWVTTRGLLNSDKYIQDSYFYQDYSYQIKAAVMLNKYKDILYNTFHTSGSELFGKYYEIINENSNIEILYEQSSANVS